MVSQMCFPFFLITSANDYLVSMRKPFMSHSGSLVRMCESDKYHLELQLLVVLYLQTTCIPKSHNSYYYVQLRVPNPSYLGMDAHVAITVRIRISHF